MSYHAHETLQDRPAYLSSFISRHPRALHTETFSWQPPFFHPECSPTGDFHSPNTWVPTWLATVRLGTAFLYPTPCLHLLGGTAFITQSYNPLCGQRQCLVHLVAKGQASKIVRGVNERVTTSVPQRTLRTLETSALPGGALVGTQAREKVTPRGLL